MTETSLALKYRPKAWKEVIGQEAVARSLKMALDKGTNRTFLLSGPSGCGKTTLARIAANVLEAEVREIDAALYTGIADMREVIATLNYKPLGKKRAVVIVDECHMLSKSAWNSMLKTLEEPPGWAYWFLCTTDLIKVPHTVQTRATKFALKPVSKGTLREWLDDVVLKEHIEMGGTDAGCDSIIDLCVKHAQGSPRAAITNLAACMAAKSKDEARELLQQVEAEAEAVELARLLLKGNVEWWQIQETLIGLKEANPESVRHVVRAYVTAALVRDGKGKNLEQKFAVLQAFSVPFAASDGMSPLVLACGGLLFGSKDA